MSDNGLHCKDGAPGVNKYIFYKEKHTVYLDFIRPLRPGYYTVEGYVGGHGSFFIHNLSVEIDAVKTFVTAIDRVQSQEYLDLDRPIAGTTFEVIIKLETNKDLTQIKFMYEGHSLGILPNRYTGLSRLLYSLHNLDDITLVKKGNKLFYHSDKSQSQTLAQFKASFAVLLNWRVGDALRKVNLARLMKDRLWVKEVFKTPLIIAEACINTVPAIIIRWLHLYIIRRENKPVWLISDRAMAANDNGEAFFRYAIKQSNDSIKLFFVISNKSKDYERLMGYGNIVNQGSLRHKLLFLRASKIISSQADIETTNPFRRQLSNYVDLMSYDFIFLQHGVIRNDLSPWLNRFNKNIQLFITSSEVEYQSILNKNYHYSQNEVLLSGLPRYDYLSNNKKNKIIVTPTYRKELLKFNTSKKGDRRYDPSFKESDYYNFYNNFINDTRILKVMREFGTIGELYIHPNFEQQRTDFAPNDTFMIAEYPYDYKRALSESSLLITDYSSIMFDFAYLKKPIIYSQFDKASFAEDHQYGKNEFFDDAKDGFGVVCRDYELLVQETIKSIERGFENSSTYQHRADEFFYKIDRCNSQRVYEAVVNLS